MLGCNNIIWGIFEHCIIFTPEKMSKLGEFNLKIHPVDFRIKFYYSKYNSHHTIREDFCKSLQVKKRDLCFISPTNNLWQHMIFFCFNLENFISEIK